MVHILLVILKFIGILLSSILGLLLFLLLVVLFAPLGYRAEGEAGKGVTRLQAGVSWLFVILRGKVVYEETGLLWYFRVCGLLIASNDKEFQEKKAEKARKKKEKKTLKAAKQQEKQQAEQKETQEATQKPKQQEKPEPTQRMEQKETQEATQKPKQQEKPEPKKEPVPAERKQLELPTSTDQSISEVASEELDLKEASENLPDTKVEKQTSQIETDRQEKSAWRQKLSRWIAKLPSIKDKGSAFYKKWKAKLLAIPAKIKTIRESLEEKMDRLGEVKDFWFEEQTQEVKERLLRDGKKMLLHILPRTFQGHIEFGLEDPYQMGQVLAVLGMLMPLYQDKLTVQPDFEEPKLNGRFFLKGRIIPGYLLSKAGLLLLNKKIRNTIKEGKKLIGGNENGRKK